MLGKVAIISLLVLAAAVYFRSGSEQAVRDGKVIQTKSGAVKGSISASRDGRDYYAWHRIPFAKAPLGHLRFADPLPLDKWTEVIDGREMGSECVQCDIFNTSPTGLIGTEDCLQLNVFAPKQLHDAIIQGKMPQHPVMVCIHGGGYVMGSSKMCNPAYFMDEDVVYVSINYRLDVLGFLTAGDKIARGNQGLKDQTTALKWVQKNIEYFGGDRNQVTIFGGSAGGASVHQQTLSHMSKGLFQRAFSLSGAASNTWGFLPLKRLVQMGKEFAEGLNCSANDNRKMIDCLREVDVETLLKQRATLINDGYVLMHPHKYVEGFAPTVEAVKDEYSFITEHPLKIISDGKAHRVPLLIGHTTHEGLGSTGDFRKDTQNLAAFESELVQALKVIFTIENTNSDEIATKIRDFYLPKDVHIDLDETIRRYVDLLSDGFFNYDIREAVRNQRKFSPVYYYLCNKTDIPDYFWVFTELTGKLPMMVDVGWYLLKSFVKENVFGIAPPFHGINHAADGVFYWRLDEFNMNVGKEDKLYDYSKDLVKMAVQFAKDDTKLEFRGVKILPTPSEGLLKVFEFKNEEVVLSPEPFTARMEFLRSLKIRH